MIITIKIQRLGSSEGFPEFKGREPVTGIIDRVLVLEAGTTAGKTTVSLLCDLPDGKFGFFQMSAEQVAMIHGAIVGAEESGAYETAEELRKKLAKVRKRNDERAEKIGAALGR